MAQWGLVTRGTGGPCVFHRVLASVLPCRKRTLQSTLKWQRHPDEIPALRLDRCLRRPEARWPLPLPTESVPDLHRNTHSDYAEQNNAGRSNENTRNTLCGIVQDSAWWVKPVL